MSDDYSYSAKEVRESKTFSTDSAKLIIMNRDFYSGKGSVGVRIESKKTRASIAFSANLDDQVNGLKSIFKPGDGETLIKTSTESFVISNKLTSKGYIIEINKLVVTSSGRSRNGLSIILDKDELEEIYGIISGLTPAERSRRKKKKYQDRKEEEK